MLEGIAPRERQIVELLYIKREATAAEVCSAMPVALSSSAVRAMLSRLEEKGFVRRRQSERGFLYAPAVPESKAKQSALRRLVQVFFDGSPAGAASALLGMSETLEDEELDELEKKIAEARKGRRK